MKNSATTQEDRFFALAEKFADNPDITLRASERRFGGTPMKVRQKIFAMLYKDQLVVKLPKGRVDELIATGKGTPFYSNTPGNSPMKEWVTIVSNSEDEWLNFSRDAINFVNSKA